MVLSDTTVAFDELIRPFGATEAGISFVGRDTVAEVSYHELAKRAAAASRDLHDRGVAPGDTVAMLIESSPEGIAAALAVWFAGATLMSLPPPPSVRQEAALTLYKERFGELLRLPSCTLAVGPRRLVETFGPDEPVVETTSLGFSSGRAAPDVGVPEIALVQFTSGSTGAPKGVVLRATTVASHVAALADAVGFDPTRDISVSWLPLYHDMGLIGMLFGTMCRRGPLVLMEPSVFARDPGTWLRTCAEAGGTVTCAPDFAYRLAARMVRFGSPPGDLSLLRVCLCGAERVSWETLQSFADATREQGLRWEALTPVFGMAEATLAVSFPPNGRGPVQGRDGVVSLGHPLPGVEVKTDGSGSEAGRVALRGPWMLESYMTADGHLDPFDSEGWLWTNDVGFVEGGELFVLGRNDEAVVVRGRNVFAEDVEAIATWTPGLEAIGAAAFRSPHGDDRFTLVVEVLNDGAAELARLAREIKTAVTRALEASVSPVVFVKPRTIPRTTSGKPVRSQCRDIYARDAWDSNSVLASIR